MDGSTILIFKTSTCDSYMSIYYQRMMASYFFIDAQNYLELCLFYVLCTIPTLN